MSAKRLTITPPHGQSGSLVDWAYGLKPSMCQNYMNISRKFGQKSNQLDFSNTVLIELSRPSVPESARQEAAEHESQRKRTNEQIAAEFEVLKEIAGREAAKRQGERVDLKSDIPENLPESLKQKSNGDARDEAAKKLNAGWSGKTAHQQRTCQKIP